MISRRFIYFLSRCLVVVACLLGRLHAATFSGNGYLAVGDSSGNLSWQPANPNKALTVACWFKLSVPSDKAITNDMVILANRRDADPNASSSYQLRYSVTSGNIEFIVRGDGAPDLRTVIARPYLERWYHVAVSRKGTLLTFYVDGRLVTPPEAPSVLLNDSTGNNEGLVVGGSSAGKSLFGEVQEVVIYQNDALPSQIRVWMFNDLPAPQLPDLKGYFKLAFATNAADQLKNFAVPPPNGTAVLQEFPTGAVAFEEADKAGEQSLFDSRKNGGRDAVSTLSGGFAWQQTVFARPVPGIAFDFRFGYQSGLAASGSKLGDYDPYEGSAVSPGWRHTFETRVVPQPTGQERHLVLWDGAIETWSRTNSRTAFRPRHLEYRGELTNVFDADGFEWLEWTTPERLVYRFYNPTFTDGDSTILAGKLDHIRDFNGNRVQLKWNPAIGVLTQAVDSVKGTYNFAYQGNAMKQVSFNSWQVNFAYDPLNRLSAKWITNTGPAAVSGISTNVNTRWEFRYGANGLLSEIVDPRGITNLTVGYDQYGSSGNWDAHGDMMTHGPLAKNVDQPIAALLRDLKQRGMLEDTLVVWTTEFGRTPFNNTADAAGREHHPWAFSSWLAGGGVKPGIVHGATDEIGLRAIEKPVHVRDFHATILHLMGFDHEKLTFRHAGLDYRLTGVEERHVVKEVLA